MNLGDVSLPLALGAGFLSFFSPCILPLVPAYIMYITGTSTEEDINRKRAFALYRTLGFVIGFTIIFIIMGSSATLLGKLFIRNKLIFAKISGILIVVFGLNMMGIINIKFLKNTRVKAPKKISNWFSSVLMGMAFAAGWTPCFGPVLGSILVMAGGSESISRGVYLLLMYSIGMAIPFILTVLFINIFEKFLNKSDRYMKYIPKIGGVILIIFGVLVFFNKVINISKLLL